MLLCLFSLTITCSKKDQTIDPNPAPEGYSLVWSDEFNSDGAPNPSNWSFEQGFVRNRELQWYQESNARCENGLLIIEGKRERVSNPNYQANSDDWQKNRQYAEYTSSSLHTRGLHSWMFGVFEMRARIDTRPGLWPAFWTLGVNGQWPHGGEIDIMEYYQGTLLANVAWGDTEPWKAVWDSARKPLSAFIDPEWATWFHLWKMEWDEKAIYLYMDDLLMNITDLSTTINRDAEKKNPFLQPHYLIVNLAIGGDAGGDPSAIVFPARYEIDYIRIYQK